MSGCSSRCSSALGHSRSAWQQETGGVADGLQQKEQLPKTVGSRPSSGKEENPNLTVVASSPPKMPPRPKAAVKTENGPAALPPLCFAVNARPPPGYLFYFAYSTYMNPDRLGSLLHRQIDKRYWAILFGFDLAFNKKGTEEGSSGGLANIVFNPFSSVEGCIFLLTPSQMDQLDAFTDAPQHYTRVVLPVWMSEVSGSESDLDLAKYCVPAVTYVAQDEWTLQDGCTPNEFVAAQCLKSADLLTPNYCDQLRSIVSAVSAPPPSQPMVS